MTQLTESFYRNVQTICVTENESALIRYLSNDGLVLLKQIYSTEIHTALNALRCRDFGLFLIKLLSLCYSDVSNDNAERALQEIPPINTIFKPDQSEHLSDSTSSNIFETLDYIFNIIVRFFYLPTNDDNPSLNVSISEMNNIRIEIARAFANLILPALTTEYKLIWFYQKKLRSLIYIFQQILSSQPTSYINHFTSNPIGSIITTIFRYLSSSTSSSSFLIQLAFDALQGFALLIENTLGNHNRILSNQRRTSNDLLNLINQFLISDYFSLFAHLIIDCPNETRACQLLEHCSIILKRLKIYRCDAIQRKQNRRFIKTSWENTFQQTCLLHQHQSSFEMTLTNRNNFDGEIEMKSNSEENTQTKRICLISAIYDKLIRLAVKQFECNQPSFAFIRDCLGYLISFGSCSCYSLSHYRALLAKINHCKMDEKSTEIFEQQSIQLLRQAFLLLSNCSQRNYSYHSHHENQPADNNFFWTYLANHLFQRPSHYSLKLVRSLPDLIQCCSTADKQTALRLCVTPSLEHYRTNVSTQSTTIIEIIECLIRTLPNLLFDIIIDRSLLTLSDTLISLATLFPTLLIHTLPVLGCLLTSTCDSLQINISEPFLQLIIKLTNAWSLSNEAIDNLCHILIILLQKCPTFRSAFYAHQCHLHLYEHFQIMLNNKSTIQSSIVACILVCISYYPKGNDNRFNYKLIFEQITLYSEKNRYQQSWFELLVRLSLSQQYQDKRTRWKSSPSLKQQLSIEMIDDDSPISSSTSTSSSSLTMNYEVEDFPTLDEDEDYYADVESLNEEIPVEIITKQNQTIYANLILFPELVILGLEIVWQNVDNEWSDQQNPIKSSIYVTNLVTYLQLLSSLVRANSYNCVVLKKSNIDGYLFTCLTKIVPRISFMQKDALISLIITLLQFLWSQSITVLQLDQCFKLILTHPSLVGPLLRLFKHLVHQIDSNQPRSYCSMPLSSIVTAKGGSHMHLTLDQLLALKYLQIENDLSQSSLSFNTVRQAAFVTETLKSVQIQFPLTVAIWLRVNYPYDKRENSEENNGKREDPTKKDYRLILHILTLHHEGIQLQFWLDSKPNICLRILQITSTTNQQLIDHIIRLYPLPRQSWSHVFLTISKTNNTVGVCLNGQISFAKKHPLPLLYSSNSPKPWSISLGQQSLDTCTSFYYDLGSILLFDKVDLSEGMNNGFVSTYLYSLGSDHWHFLTAGQQSLSNYWIYQRFTRVHPSITINQFENEQNSCHTTLRRSLIASYSSNNPWTLFLFNTNPETNDEMTISRLNKILTFRTSASTLSLNSSSNTSNDDHLLSSAITISLPSKISLEQSSNILNICEQLGGILNFIYLFGKIIEINAYQSSSSICDISDIIFSSIWKIKSYYDLFNSLDGYRLIVKILTTNECTRHITQQFYEILIDKCIVLNQQRLYDIHLFRVVLLDWKIWYNHSSIFLLIFKTFNDLLSDQTNLKYSNLNRQLFQIHYPLQDVLTLCQELLEEQQQIILDENLSRLFVNIIEVLIENDIDTITSLVHFVLLIHPLVKTYVTYNKEHFYFIVKPFQYYPREPVQVKQNHLPPSEQESIVVVNEENTGESSSNLRKSHSFSDLASSIENESNSNRRPHHVSISAITVSKIFPIESKIMKNKDRRHDIDYLSTGILKLLGNIALTTPDRLMMKLIDNVFRLNILIVLLLDASIAKRVQCIRLLDIVLKRMDREKVQTDVLQKDLHTMLANQIYHQLDGREDEKPLLEICLSIALQRPTEFDLKRSLTEQIDDFEQYFSILSMTPPCPRAQVGLALTLSFVEKLSMTNPSLCELILNLLEMMIQRSNDEIRHFLVDAGLTQVLFNTLSSAIATSQEKIIVLTQKCFNTLIVMMFTTTINDDVSFQSIIDNIIGIMMNEEEIPDSDSSKYQRRILHHTLSNVFNSIIDSINKPSSPPVPLYRSTGQRNSHDDHGLNPILLDNHDRFRKFLQIAIDYVYSFHDECQFLESFTVRLLDITLLGIAYLIEKRTNHLSSRYQISSLIYRCEDIIKPIGQKLLTIALDPEKQNFFFRVQILKHIIDQPNAKGIMEYLLQNDHQCHTYHQLLLYLQILSKIKPTETDIEHMNNQSSSEQSRTSFDSGHATNVLLINNQRARSDDEDSSSHTVHIATSTNATKQLKTMSQRATTSNNMPNKQSSSTDEEKEKALPTGLSNSSPVNEEPVDNRPRKISDRSSSPSLSFSSLSSDLTSLQQSSVMNYPSIINSFRELMGRITIPSTTNDIHVLQRRGLAQYLLSPSSAAFVDLKNTLRQNSLRHSIDIPLVASPDETYSSLPINPTTLTDRLRRRRSQMATSTIIPTNMNWQKLAEQKFQEYTNALTQFIETTQKRLIDAHKSSLQTFTNVNISTITSQAMKITQDVVGHQSAERKKFMEHLRSTQSVDLQTKHLWHQLIAQLTHEYAVWFEPLSYPKYWELDPTENPQRERRRLQRSYCLMEKRFFQSQIPEEILVSPPLSYLFDTRHYPSVSVQTVLHRSEKLEYQCGCTNVTPNNEVKGEFLLGATRIYFIPDEQIPSTTKTKSTNSAMTSFGYNQHSFNDNSNSFSFAIDDICEMYKRRYLLTDLALELFFINGITLMIAHGSTEQRDHLYNLLAKRNVSHAKPEDKVAEIQSLWKQGYVNNFDYLMQLNKLAGRTYLDLMQYPVYPYIVSNYEVGILDLRLPSNYRNLAKPIAVQHPDKEEKFIDVYSALEDARALEASRQQESDQQDSLQNASIFGHQSDPYHFASLYSNSGIVLHYLVRLLPYTRMFLDYQDNNFDCADRTFHDVKTSYWLSSYESTSDFKEIIPEFYYLHEFLFNKQGFNFGKRQNGEPVSDVTVTPWSKRNARLYVYGLRQAIESDYVTMHLHQWIDLIFGCKQTGKAALDAINVYHAACYYGFPIKSIKDEVTQKAYHGIIRTYGQVPKQLFSQSHPVYSAAISTSNQVVNDKRNNERMVFESKLPPDSIHRQIIGVQWGDFVGSYDMPSPDYTTNYDCPVQVASFVVRNSGSCIICLPSSSLLVYNEYIVNESTGEQVNSSSTQLDTMIALKWNTADGIVRCRQLKQMKNWYNFLVPIDDQDKITCCTSIDYRLLFMGKKSGLIEVHRIERNKNAPGGIELVQRCLPFIAHRSSITCLHVNRPFSLLISASADGMLTLWDTNRLSYVRTFKQDNQTIYHLTSSDATGDIAYLSSSGSQWHLTYLTCNCDLIGCLTFPEQLNCLCFTSAPEGTSVNVLLGGFENGLILMWSTWDLTLLRRLDFLQLRSHPIAAICVSKVDRRRLYVADRNRHLHTIESRSWTSAAGNAAPQILFLS